MELPDMEIAINDIDETEWHAVTLHNEVFDFLNDETEDIYTMEDGEPIG